jgi:sugar lactone lactonase YvrE
MTGSTLRSLYSVCFVVALGMTYTPLANAQGARTRATEDNCASCFKAKAFNSPEIPSDVKTDFLKLPQNLYFGETPGVATNSKAHIFVFTRSRGSQLFEFDQEGNFVREIGQGSYGFGLAHVVRIDSQDNIWAVDSGTNVVTKFNPAGRIEMVIGRRPESHGLTVTPPEDAPVPTAQPYLLNRPTDVAWDAAGDIFISDGYGNSRVVKYDKNGRFIKDVGEKGTKPGEFDNPHGIATDAKGNIYVADRNNARIQVFDKDLNYKTLYDNVGFPWSVCISQGPHQYLYSTNSNPNNSSPEISAVTGEIYKMELDGTIIGKFAKSGKRPGQVSTIHQIDCRNDNVIMGSEIAGWRVHRFTLHPKTESASLQTSGDSK